MDLLKVVEKNTSTTTFGLQHISWVKVKAEMDQVMGVSLSIESYRSKYRRMIGTHIVPEQKQTQTVELQGDKSKQVERLKKALKDPHSLSDLVVMTGLSDIEVYGYIGQFRNDGDEILDFKMEGDIIFVSTKNTVSHHSMQEINHYHDVSKVIKFGVVSDTHMCSKYEQHSYLQLAYDDFVKENISKVYHIGDLSEGWYQNRPGHIFELHKIGFDQQKDYIVKNYPKRDGVETEVIGGNHDATHIKNGGADIVAAVCKERPDMHHLGQADAKVWLTDKIDMDLKHPDGGSSYAYSYRPQKIVESLPGGDKPRILFIGHYHKNFFMFYRGVFIICVPSFIRQTPFMKGLALVSDVGYVIIELKANENGDIIELTPRFKMFYKMLTDDYVH
jgi:predicted phosphodiesterase/biotin operon repressor